jgi:hypothetical protein
MSLEALSINRKTLKLKMRLYDQWYLESEWVPKEEQFIWYHTKSYPNLGSTASQRGESYHPIVREITNSQLSFEESGKRLSRKMLSILKDLATDEDSSLRGYDRLAQLDFAAFKYLVMTISNEALKKIEEEWHELKVTLLANQNTDLGTCRCELLLRFGLPCKHHLKRAYLQGMPIPRSLIHPRWWLKGPVVHQSNWQPRYPDEDQVEYLQPEMTDIETLGRQIDGISEQLQPEERACFRRQREAEHLKLLIAGKQHLELQALPIGNPDPIPKRIFRKKKTHGKANARALTGTEIVSREHEAREAALVANAICEDVSITLSSTPPPTGEPLYQTTMPLRPSPRRAPQDDVFEEACNLPPPTAPPRLKLVQEQAQKQAQGQTQEQALEQAQGHTQSQAQDQVQGQVQRQEQVLAQRQVQEQAQGEVQKAPAEEQEQGRGKRRKIAKKLFDNSTLY